MAKVDPTIAGDDAPESAGKSDSVAAKDDARVHQRPGVLPSEGDRDTVAFSADTDTPLVPQTPTSDTVPPPSALTDERGHDVTVEFDQMVSSPQDPTLFLGPKGATPKNAGPRKGPAAGASNQTLAEGKPLEKTLASDQRTLARGQGTLADAPQSGLRSRSRRRDKEPPLPTRVAGYEILGELGRGGMGVVYKARQPGAKRVVALKMVLASRHAGGDALARFQLEAEAIAGLQHPNIVQLFEVGTEGGCPFFSLEYIDGDSLDRKVEGVPQPPRDSAALVQALAEAMHVAHERGIIHRDLKPANILLTQDGLPKITDFGLAKRCDDSSDGPTQTGAIMGTPSYMAPEQAQGNTKTVGPAVDIYALGAILYDLLTGRPPFRGTTVMETLQQVQSMEPLPPTHLQPTLPVDLQTICLKALEKDPVRRYQTAAELADDLKRYLAGEPIRARPTPWYERGWKWARRRPALAALASVSAVGAAIVLGLGFLWLDSERRAAEDREKQQAEVARLEAGQADAARTQADMEKALRKKADESFQKAERNFQRARRAVDQMFSRIAQESMAHVPQMEEVRREVLEKALGFYQEFLDEGGNDPSLRRELARAQQRVADIREMLGEHRLAETAYQSALGLLIPLTKELPDRLDYQSDLADTSNQFANLLKDLKRHQEAEKFYRAALKVRQDLVLKDPNNNVFRFDLARGHVNLGMVLHLLGKTGAAEVEYEASREPLHELVGKHPNNHRYAAELASALDMLGNLQRELGRPGDAEVKLLEANARLLKITDKAPTNVDYRHLLGLNHHHLGDLYRDSKPKLAEEHYQAALGIRIRLVKEFPLVPLYRQDLAGTHANRAILLQSAGRQKEADAAYKEALAIQTRAADDFALLPDNRRRLASTYINYGNMLLGASRLKEGEAAFRKAEELLDALTTAHAEVPEYQGELATALLNLGAAAFADRRAAQGRTYFEKALEIRETLAGSHPDVPIHQQKLGDTLLNWATLLQILKQPEAAEKTYNRASEIYAGLEKSDPRNPDYRRLLALSLNNLSTLQRGRKDVGAAEASWRRALDLFRGLVKDFPDNPDYQQELARGLNDFGVYHLQGQRLPEAESALSEGLEAIQKLRQRFPERLVYRHDEAILHDSLGGLRNKKDQPEQAVAEFRKALALLEAADISPSNRLEFSQQIISTHRNLVNLLEAIKKPAEAEKSWLRILEEREKLAKAFPKDTGQRLEAVNVLEELGNRALQNAKFDVAAALYVRAIAQMMVLLPQDPVAHAGPIYLLRLNLAQAELGLKHHADAANLVELCRAMDHVGKRHDQLAASILARCAGLVDKDSPLRKRYSDLAMKCLEEAVQRGLRDAKIFMSDDWQALRERDDFRALLQIVDPKK